MAAPIGMRYQTFAPPPHLADHVEHFWMVDAPAHPAPHREILIPNGRPTVLVRLGEVGRRIAVHGGQSTANVSNCAGPITQPLILEQHRASCYVAAQLHPWGLRAFGLPPLIDAVLPIGEWLGAEASAALESACAQPGFGADAALPLQQLLSQRLRPFPEQGLRRLRAAVEAAEAEQGLITVEALQDRLGIGYDALYRLFKGGIGLSVKRFLSLMRFYHFSGELLHGGFGSLALLAGMRGYYDQAHASREFKRYTGIGQTEFLRHLNGIAKLMHGTG